MTKNSHLFAGSQTLLASEREFSSTGNLNSTETVGDARRLRKSGFLRVLRWKTSYQYLDGCFFELLKQSSYLKVILCSFGGAKDLRNSFDTSIVGTIQLNTPLFAFSGKFKLKEYEPIRPRYSESSILIGRGTRGGAHNRGFRKML